jgi:AcrR family transcriptional regulator
MKKASTANQPSNSPARRSLLDTATRLFYAEGIHAVGIDRIIAEAGVAKATFYKHFRSKDDLVRVYIEELDQLGRAAVQRLPPQKPRDMIAAILARISDAAATPEFRGCPFLNTAAEYPDPESPVRRAIDARRTWYRNHLKELLAADGDPTPSSTADLLVVLSDGLLESAYVDDPGKSPGLVQAAVDRVLGSRR